MEASEWPHSFDLTPKRPIFNFLDESQKIAAREARPGGTREAFFRAAGDHFKAKNAISI
jgi:hypothetical protein